MVEVREVSQIVDAEGGETGTCGSGATRLVPLAAWPCSGRRLSL